MGASMKDRNRIKGPKGEWLHITLLQVIARDPITGRASECRLRYDDEEIGLVGTKGPDGGPPEFFMVWMTGSQLHGKPRSATDAVLRPAGSEVNLLQVQKEALENAKKEVDDALAIAKKSEAELVVLQELKGFVDEIDRRLAALGVKP
jgi:hypothetical protein